MARTKVQKPDYHNHGKYQFVTGYTGWGNPECVHLSAEEISERLTEQYGPGKLEDDGEDLWWVWETEDE